MISSAIIFFPLFKEFVNRRCLSWILCCSKLKLSCHIVRSCLHPSNFGVPWTSNEIMKLMREKNNTRLDFVKVKLSSICTLPHCFHWLYNFLSTDNKRHTISLMHRPDKLWSGALVSAKGVGAVYMTSYALNQAMLARLSWFALCCTTLQFWDVCPKMRRVKLLKSQ